MITALYARTPSSYLSEGFTHMKDSPHSDEGQPHCVTPLCLVGDEVIFRFEGNLRARVEGFEVVGGRVRLDCRASLIFLVPLSQVVCVEREG